MAKNKARPITEPEAAALISAMAQTMKFKISRIAVDGNALEAVEGHHVSQSWKNQAGVLVHPHPGVRKDRQNEES